MGVPRAKDQLPTTSRVSILTTLKTLKTLTPPTTLTIKVAALIFLTSSDHRGCLSMQQSGINWRASCRPGNQLRLWLLDLEPIGILRTSMPNILKLKAFIYRFCPLAKKVP